MVKASEEQGFLILFHSLIYQVPTAKQYFKKREGFIDVLETTHSIKQLILQLTMDTAKWIIFVFTLYR